MRLRILPVFALMRLKPREILERIRPPTFFRRGTLNDASDLRMRPEADAREPPPPPVEALAEDVADAAGAGAEAAGLVVVAVCGFSRRSNPKAAAAVLSARSAAFCKNRLASVGDMR